MATTLTPTLPLAHFDSVPTIERKELIDFKNRYLVAANASIAMTGNLTLSQAKKIVDNITADLPVGQAAKTLPEPKPLNKARIFTSFSPDPKTVLWDTGG